VDVYLLAELHHSLVVFARSCGNKGDLRTAELSIYIQEWATSSREFCLLVEDLLKSVGINMP
jgi:hypothetical protein